MAALFLCCLLFLCDIFDSRVHAQNKESRCWLGCVGIFFQTLGSELSSETIIGLILLFIINFVCSQYISAKKKKYINLKRSEEVDGQDKKKKALHLNLCAKKSPPPPLLECVWTCQEAAMMEPRAGQTEWVEVISVKIGRILLWGRMRLVANEKGRRQSREGRGDGRLAGKQGFNRLTGLSTKSSPPPQSSKCWNLNKWMWHLAAVTAGEF